MSTYRIIYTTAGGMECSYSRKGTKKPVDFKSLYRASDKALEISRKPTVSLVELQSCNDDREPWVIGRYKSGETLHNGFGINRA